VREFVTEDVKPHRFRQQKENHSPAGRARQKWNPSRVRAAAGQKNFPQSYRCARANGQQQNGEDEFDPLRHGERLATEAQRHREKYFHSASLWLCGKKLLALNFWLWT
jgi:hypothetical protein